ncbi:16S ribosomal RNA methyltransferase KsgA/Dim1 family protein [Halovivax asiaticus JCM 14624]|uniref:Probable ribosomal RNA small subunit methyltransferase A n=1 Tax=Halovivax asiaticus JCM 14624 TaxID=1227490 RepID=M0BV60_9EURY|nr:16S ribosomal RNA methyltransferase A [Halovivax asiaticus]ELZ13519.1 16S ribosomal RNA methyltransferase KsgA/Dim1 family protein [Halovivax asiaticus JCM 14624]
MRDPDDLLARAGVRGNPDRDQHFLVDDRVLDRLPTYLDAVDSIDGDDDPPERGPLADAHLLEIGPGTGALTDRLLATGATVTAIERDRKLAGFLRREFDEAIDAGRLTVIEDDALDVALPDVTASVSNLPYSASSDLTFRLLPRGIELVLMFQREFAERMVAEPGTSDYGRLSVSTQHYAAVEIVETVPPEAFSPPPAVDSAIVRTEPRAPSYEVADETFFLRFVKALFTQRRKTVRNGIRNTAHISELDDPAAVVDATPEDLLAKRPDAVTPTEFAELATIAESVADD